MLVVISFPGSLAEFLGQMISTLKQSEDVEWVLIGTAAFGTVPV